MKFVRELEINTKLYSCFAIMLGLSAFGSLWLLRQLAQVGDAATAAAAKAKGNVPLAQLAELAQAGAAATQTWTMVYLAVGLVLGIMMCLWLAAEVARPIHEAVLMARRVAFRH